MIDQHRRAEASAPAPSSLAPHAADGPLWLKSYPTGIAWDARIVPKPLYALLD